MRFERGHCDLRISSIEKVITDGLMGVFVDMDLSMTPVAKNRVVTFFLVAFTRANEDVTFSGRFLRFERDHCEGRISKIDAEI